MDKAALIGDLGVAGLLKPSWRYRVAFSISVLAFGILGGWLGKLAADREVPVVVQSYEVLNTEVLPGEDLRIRYKLLRRRSCDVVVDRFIKDSEDNRHELLDSRIHAGLPLGEEAPVLRIQVPLEASRGPAIYRTVTTFRCNFTQWLSPIQGGTLDIGFTIK